MVGDDVEITLLDLRSGQIKLGISAPPHVAVHRFEIWDRIRRGGERQRRPMPPAPAVQDDAGAEGAA